MKKIMKKQLLVLFAGVFSVITCLCTPKPQTIRHSLKAYADQIKIINTHEHQHLPEEYGYQKPGFYHLVQAGYLMADLVSAGAQWVDSETLDTLDLESGWDMYGSALDYCRTTSYYGHFMRGFQKLYNFNELYFTRANVKALNRRIENNYADYPKWFDRAFHKAGFELMFLDQYWNPFNTDIDRRYFALVFHINPLVMQVSRRPGPGEKLPALYQNASKADFSIESLGDYLEFCHELFEQNINAKAVCVKNSMAYSRTQFFEDVPFAEADMLYRKPSSRLSRAEAKKLQDFMFHWIIQQSAAHDLPIQIHTGYLAGNGNTLDNGKPTKLNNLFLKYPDAQFVLFHGGYPWTGEYAALGKMFPNVYLDLVWLPQISRQEAVHALDEILDTVPYNKLFWGGDCGLVEESVGSLEFAKSVVVEVLAARMIRGLLTKALAREIIRRILRDNAVEVFNLEEKLDRTF